MRRKWRRLAVRVRPSAIFLAGMDFSCFNITGRDVNEQELRDIHYVRPDNCRAPLKVNNSMSAENIKIFNANPWKQHIPDCAIRAVTMAIGLRYELVCKKFGVSWKRGRGLIRDTGIQLEDIKRVFNGYFGAIVDFNEEMPPDLVENPAFDEVSQIDRELGVVETESGITLAEFIDIYAGQG